MDGGRFDVRFENKWYTSVAPGTNLVRTAVYEDPNLANIMTKIDWAVTEIKRSMPVCS